MNTIRPVVILAAAMLVGTAAGCDKTPTAVDDDAVMTAQFSGGAQNRVSLCHRTSSGAYNKITIADAAYDTHMAHGDRTVGADGECITGAASRLEVWVDVDTDQGLDHVVILLYPESGGEFLLGTCAPGELCVHDVPTGSTVTLSSAGSYEYAWSDPTCTGTVTNPIGCMMDEDRSVVVTKGVSGW
jgi:hypothetical protein